jgi:hypothetical protein
MDQILFFTENSPAVVWDSHGKCTDPKQHRILLAICCILAGIDLQYWDDSFTEIIQLQGMGFLIAFQPFLSYL